MTITHRIKMYDTNRMWDIVVARLNSAETTDEKIYTILNRDYSDEVRARITLPVYSRKFEFRSLALLKVLHD